MKRLILLSAAASLCAIGLTACGPSEPKTSGTPVSAQRLSEAQYRQSIADIFGADIRIGGRFEPNARKTGLLAVGASVAGMSPSGFEQYDTMARSIANQAVDAKHRDSLIPCKPAAVNTADKDCATATLAKYGRELYRRTLTKDELTSAVDIADAAATTKGDFYSGLAYGLAQFLDSPSFLFRKDMAEPDPDDKTRLRLTGFAVASRLSYFLWNTTPDDDLLRAAESGELNKKSGIAKQVDRMLASPRLDQGARAFFVDFLNFDRFDSLAKDGQIYPVFNANVAKDVREQTLRTLVDLTITNKGDYRDVFTSRKTFLTRNLGVIYQVPVSLEAGWEPHEFAPDDPHAGLLTQLAFLELFSHPGRSSATLRGKAVREILLCQVVPSPPANVNFTVVQDTNNPQYKTARERLTAHRTEATCAGCHKIMDPIGLGLENFDSVGEYRDTENGASIDASGDIDGLKFTDAKSLGQALHDDPVSATCLADSLYRYGVGRDFDPSEKDWRKWLDTQFAANGYRVPDLMRMIATSDAFYAVRAAPTDMKEAAR